jgi:hypothetical protein
MIGFAGKAIGEQIAGLILEVREVRPLRQALGWHMNVPSSWCLSSAFAGRKVRSWIDLDEGGLLSFPRIGGAPVRRPHSNAPHQPAPRCGTVTSCQAGGRPIFGPSASARKRTFREVAGNAMARSGDLYPGGIFSNFVSCGSMRSQLSARTLYVTTLGWKSSGVSRLLAGIANSAGIAGDVREIGVPQVGQKAWIFSLPLSPAARQLR